jgi:hypothetical protein
MAVSRIDKGVRLKTTHARAGAFVNELILNAEGFDRSRPIQYWRATTGGYPAGTTEADKTLDDLNVPLDWGRRRVRALLADKLVAAEAKGVDPEPFRIGNDVLAGAIRYRKTHVLRPGQTPSGHCGYGHVSWTPFCATPDTGSIRTADTWPGHVRTQRTRFRGGHVSGVSLIEKRTSDDRSDERPTHQPVQARPRGRGR